MKQTADLDAALGFVVGRIEAEAARSDETLSDEQSRLLHDLPKQAASPPEYALDPEFPMTVMQPRDAAYERLVALAKGARRADLQLDSSSELDWEFAAAVSKLNRHPIVLALGLGGRESAQTMVGWLAPSCFFIDPRILGLSSIACRCNRILETIRLGSDRCCLPCDRNSSVLCFSLDREMAVKAKNRKLPT